MKTYNIYKGSLTTVIEVVDNNEIIDRKHIVTTYVETTGSEFGTIEIKEFDLNIPYQSINGTNFNSAYEAMNWIIANRFFEPKEGVTEIVQGTSNFAGTQVTTTVTGTGTTIDDTILLTPIGDSNSDLKVTNTINDAFTVTRIIRDVTQPLIDGLGFSWIRI
jgi:hypothetical protein